MKRILICLLALMMFMSAAALAEETSATMVVNGTGTVSVSPDRAVITFGVRRSSTDIAEAQAYVNAHLGEAIDKLLEMGVKKENLQTSVIRIEEDYGYNGEALPEGETAYMVENTVSAIIEDVDSAGSVIDAAFEAGINYLSGIQFIASDTEKAQEQALTLAVEAARHRAELLAEASDMNLGQLIRISDTDNYYGNNRMFAKTEGAADSFAGQVYTMDIDVTVSVTMEFELEPKE